MMLCKSSPSQTNGQAVSITAPNTNTISPNFHLMNTNTSKPPSIHKQPQNGVHNGCTNGHSNELKCIQNACECDAYMSGDSVQSTRSVKGQCCNCKHSWMVHGKSN